MGVWLLVYLSGILVGLGVMAMSLFMMVAVWMDGDMLRAWLWGLIAFTVFYLLIVAIQRLYEMLGGSWDE